MIVTGALIRPLKSAVLSLVANTAPVAFGALATPIVTLATVSGLPQDDLGGMVGRQTPLLALFVPLILVFIVDRKNGIRDTWPAAVVCGVAFAIVQSVASNYVSVPLTDILASLLSAGAVVLLLRVWQPAHTYVEPEVEEPVAVGGGVATAGRTGSPTASPPPPRPPAAPAATFRATFRAGTVPSTSRSACCRRPSVPDVPDTRVEIARAYAPYLIIVAVFVVAQLPGIKPLIAKTTHVFAWPGLHLFSSSGKVSTIPNFTFNWLATGGTLLLIAGLITIPVLKLSFGQALRAYVTTYKQLWTAIITVMAVLALAYVMNASGQTATLGNWMAGAGGAFAALSPIIGWLGVAVTGSDTSSNSLFGALQVTAANKAGLDSLLMAASNSSGGVLGKMVSPQNLAIAAAAVGMAGREGDVFRRVFGWSLFMLAVMVVIVVLQSTAVLGWMVI